jgi:hypothetical protein
MNTIIDLAMTGWEAFRSLPMAAQTGIGAVAGLICTGLVLSRRPTDQVRQSV